MHSELDVHEPICLYVDVQICVVKKELGRTQ